MVTYDFGGKIALVTGGASGIGRASAELFAASGATVVIADRDAERGVALAARLCEANKDAHFKPVDVSNEHSVGELFAAIEEQFGRLDVALNNAGVEAEIQPIERLGSASWKRTIETNLSSVFYCLRAEIELMGKTDGGNIVNTSSVLGLMGSYSHADYVASKHGVVGLTKAAALDHARDGIRVNAVCPGLVDTPFSGEMSDAIRERLLTAAPVGRMADPAEIARAVMWLCSEDSSYVTGHALAVDGGVMIGGSGTRFDDLL